MENRILKLALGLLVLTVLGFAGYRFIQNKDRVEIQSVVTSLQGHHLCKGTTCVKQ